jgi:F-type H+-transporting ATPase subunit b
VRNIALAVGLVLGLGSFAHADEVGSGSTEPVEDPSAHFNLFDFGYSHKDQWGSPFGDGKNEDPATHEVEKTTDKNGNVVNAEEEKMSPPFILGLINFGLLLIVLGKFLVPAGRRVAEERHDQIKTALEEAAKLRAAAEQKLKEYEGRIAGVDAEIEKLVAGIRADAEADKQRILDNAAQQAAQMKREAEQRIAAEIEQARAQLTDEVSAAAAAAAGKLVRERATGDDHKRLVTTFISGLGGRP